MGKNIMDNIDIKFELSEEYGSLVKTERFKY
jgi:hypothetical protein